MINRFAFLTFNIVLKPSAFIFFWHSRVWNSETDNTEISSRFIDSLEKKICFLWTELHGFFGLTSCNNSYLWIEAQDKKSLIAPKKQKIRIYVANAEAYIIISLI